MVTIKDIANLAGVSKTTVSKVLNNKDQKISESTRQKILNIVRENNYVPNKMAQSLVTKKTKTIGLIIPDIRNPFFTDIARGAEDKAVREGYNIILCNTDENIEKETRAFNTLTEKMVDGIIFAPSSKTEVNSNEYKISSKPIVLVDKELNIENLKGVVSLDNEEGTYLGTKHLVGISHKDILYLSGPLKSEISINRLKGYKKALKESNIKFNEDLVIQGEYSFEWGYEVVKNLYEINFTAICAANDLIAIGAIKALKERGIKIPQDISIVGFDDIQTANIIEPQLTTIKQNSYDMGYESASILINNLENKEINNIEKMIFKPELVIRSSTSQNFRGGRL
ncbi:LacI family DNA-binding transcriptional regulator [Paraclostridium tenue]